MFISAYEKNKLFNKLDQALKELSLANAEITDLKGKTKALEGNVFVLKQIVDFNKKPKKEKTPEQKAKQAEYMRRYKAKKAAERKAKLAQVIA
jgi:HD superfamily phosphohydrolase